MYRLRDTQAAAICLPFVKFLHFVLKDRNNGLQAVGWVDDAYSTVMLESIHAGTFFRWIRFVAWLQVISCCTFVMLVMLASRRDSR